MKKLYNESEYKSVNSTTKLLLECYNCGHPFGVKKGEITRELKHNRGRCKYCSVKCHGLSQVNKIKTTCNACHKTIYKVPNQYKRSKNSFCNSSCAATYNNKHKTTGNRRSKLEEWIEDQLTILYPDLEILFNDKTAIESELDVYIPSLNVAFEINGIFHYEPIYGVDKLASIQTNDVSKSKACHDAKIDLCVIDTSAQRRFKPTTSQKYLDIVTNIINTRLLTS